MELLDLSVIDEVRDALGDDAYRGYAMRMLDEMRSVGPELALLLEGDRKTLAQVAHRAAGSAVSVGAKGLHARLKGIEDAARGGGAGLETLVGGFSADVEATEAAISALLTAP